MYIPDGAPYAYFGDIPAGVRAIAVGWLDAEHPYTTGHSSESFIRLLFEACHAHTSAITFGWHECELCAASGNDTSSCVVSYRGKRIAVGTAEVRVVGRDGTWLIAPTLIIHYVLEHNYEPPAEFVDAILAGRFAQEAAGRDTERS